MSRPTTARRDLFAGASALLLGTAAAVTVTTAPAPDAALLDAFRRWQPWERERQAVAAIYRDHPDEHAPDGRHIADDRFDAYTDSWHDLLDEIMAMPARTPEGVRAKATVLRATLLNHVGDFGSEQLATASPSETLAWSLVNDMLAAGGAA